MKILLVVISCIFLSANVRSQINSAALDDACYQPLVGQGVDTIYGDKNGALLGLNVINMGPWLDESYGRVGTFGLPGHTSQFSTFKTGTDFNLHKLKEVESFGNIDLHGVSKSQIRFCHFRSQKIKDLLVHAKDEEKIYWADENGKYDSSRYTMLVSPIQGIAGFKMQYLNPSYTGYFTSDSVEDIVQGGIKWGGNGDSAHIFLYRGSNLLNQGLTALPDSVYTVYNITYLTSTYWTIMGDFRGTGRKDLILYANDTGGVNLLYYKNDLPFTMEKFYNAIMFDTLYSHADNPSNREGTPHPEDGSVMQAFSRPVGDPTVDFLQVFITSSELTDRSLWVFKGGPNFGSQRLYIDSPSYLILHPYNFDSGFDGVPNFFRPRDCGDMTGTGNRVLGSIALTPLGGNAGIFSFYVLGDAMDSKIDMIYVEQNHPSGTMDTLTADGDGLQDVIIGMPGYTTPKDEAKGWKDVGSLAVIRGSMKIPVKLNEVFATEERERLKTTPMYAYPNPLDQKTTLTFENCTSGVMYMDVVSSIGVSVIHEEIPDVDGLQQYSADLSGLPAGAYHIRLVCPADGWSASTSVIKSGAAVKPWSLDLRKAMGR